MNRNSGEEICACTYFIVYKTSTHRWRLLEEEFSKVAAAWTCLAITKCTYTLVRITTTSLQNFRENVDENFSCYPNKCSMEVHKLTLLLYSTKYNNNDKRHGTRKIYKFLIYTQVKHMPWPPPPIILLYLLKTIFYLSHILSNTCMMMMYYYNYL